MGVCIDPIQPIFDARICFYKKKKTFFPNFNYISHRLADIFGKKSAIGSGATFPISRGLNS